jgi:hypothetical protein
MPSPVSVKFELPIYKNCLYACDSGCGRYGFCVAKVLSTVLILTLFCLRKLTDFRNSLSEKTSLIWFLVDQINYVCLFGLTENRSPRIILYSVCVF